MNTVNAKNVRDFVVRNASRKLTPAHRRKSSILDTLGA